MADISETNQKEDHLLGFYQWTQKFSGVFNFHSYLIQFDFWGFFLFCFFFLTLLVKHLGEQHSILHIPNIPFFDQIPLKLCYFGNWPHKQTFDFMQLMRIFQLFQKTVQCSVHIRFLHFLPTSQHPLHLCQLPKKFWMVKPDLYSR